MSLVAALARARTPLLGVALSATVAAQLLFDAKRAFWSSLGLYAAGLLLLAVAVARPLRASEPDPSPEGDPLGLSARPRSAISLRLELALLAAVLVVGAFFRFFQLDTIPPGFNHDAAMHCQYAIELLFNDAPLAPYFVPPHHYPIGYETFQPLVTAAYMSFLGVVPLAGKLSSATSGFAALVVLYLAARYLFGTRLALITTFLGAICGWHIVFARSGWHCIAVPLWETFAMLLLLSAVQTGRLPLFGAAGGATAVNLMTYSISRLLLPKQALILAFLWLRGRLRLGAIRRGALVFFVTFAALSAPVVHWAVNHWEAFQGRTRVLLVFNRIASDGLAPLADNLAQTLLNLNYQGNGDDFIIGDPLLDFPTSWLFAVGFVLCSLLADRPRHGVLLLWFAASMVPGFLSNPNPNHNIAALIPAVMMAGVAADWLLGGALRMASTRGRWHSAAVHAAVGAIAIALVAMTLRTYIAPSTRREIEGLYPETRAVGEHLRDLIDRYDVHVAGDFPVDILTFLTYRGGSFTSRFQYLGDNGESLLVQELRPVDGKGAALVARASPEGDAVARGLMERFPGARRVELEWRPHPRGPARPAAILVFLDPEVLEQGGLPLPRGQAPLAGRGKSIFTGGAGTEPGQFDQIMGLAVAPDGTIYATDMRNDRLQKFDRDGEFLWALGAKGADFGKFQEPRGVAVDAAGNVFVVDSWNSRVQSFDPDGRFRMAFTTPRRFFGPKGIAVRGSEILVADTGNGSIEVFNAAGHHVATLGRPGRGAGELRDPVGIAVDDEGLIYIADTGNGRIQVFARDGSFVRAWPVDGWSQGDRTEAFLAWDPDRGLLVSDPGGNRVFAFDAMGASQRIVASATSPAGLAVRAGLVLVAERFENRVKPIREELSAP
ncbi:MAG TPA: SMP-30/gluconolactonase/LRE family protein [Thermoanaerobaculaceae bacterium]|nr:SMP-30/gluconolactonase/LRE family protein [Thermoanaerobaculaceae bacterium]HRS16969.1 SMP-30/gluconolactonase/LRE family protein [Thermoanaerobaculaceae bacterium]